MQKRLVWFLILVSCGFSGANALAVAAEVVILSCGVVTPSGGGCPPGCSPPLDGINVTSLSVKAYSLPSSVSVGAACAAAIADLIGSGFVIVNVEPVGAGFGATNNAFTTPQITYMLFKGK
jgi:hypothetical protein